MGLNTSFGFFLFAGVLAMIMLAQLMRPDQQLVSDQQYNQLFIMHGAIMLPLFARHCSSGSPMGSCR